MKIPFINKYDPNIEAMEDINEKKSAIKNKMNECSDMMEDSFSGSIVFLVFGCIPFCIMGLLVYMLKDYIEDILKVVKYVILISVGIAFFARLIFASYHQSLRNRYERLLEKISDNEKEEIKEKVDEDVFENSIKLSYKYLDEYYSQTREQAQNGFNVTVFVAVFGAILIAAGIIIMYKGEIEPAYVTCTAGIITEFIAAIFFYLYNRTITSVLTYWYLYKLT